MNYADQVQPHVRIQKCQIRDGDIREDQGHGAPGQGVQNQSHCCKGHQVTAQSSDALCETLGPSDTLERTTERNQLLPTPLRIVLEWRHAIPATAPETPGCGAACTLHPQQIGASCL